MKPFKSGRPLSQWLLRIGLLVTLFVLYFNTASTMKFTSIPFLIAATALACGVLLFIGGMISKPWLTILTGLIIAAISVYKIVITFNGALDHTLIMHFIPFALGFHFLTYGNDK